MEQKLEDFTNPDALEELFKIKKRKKSNIIDDESEDAYTFIKSPPFINGTLREYQLEGVNWLINMHLRSINCILADEMGLGKTLQTITFLGYLKFIEKERKPHLLIVPKSIMYNWRSEFEKFMPKYKVFVFHGVKENIDEVIDEYNEKNFDAVITTYEMCMRLKKKLNQNWSYVIIDEGHRIKNEESLLSKVVRTFVCDHRLLLTGTPLQNNVHELWALLNFLSPKLFKDAEKFENWILSVDQNDQEAVNNLRGFLQFFFLRREKSDVEQNLLPKIVINLYAKLTPMQRRWYRAILEKDLVSILGRESKSSLLNILMRLRQCCNHPYLFEGAEPGPPFTTDEHIVNNSGKLLIIDKLLVKLKQKGSRVLIFSQMTSMLDILEDYCEMREYEYRRIDGSTTAHDRVAFIDDFNRENSQVFIFLLSTRAGGLGINLATADTVILHDIDWNPQADLQAQDRAHRIGQTKQVTVYRMIVENSIEERILYQAMKKLKLDEMLVSKSKSRKNIRENLNERDLMGILATGVDEIYKDDNEELADIDEIIRIGEEKTRQLNAQIEEIKITEDGSETKIYEWEGEDYKLKQRLASVIENKKPTRPALARFSRATLISRTRQKNLQIQPHQFYPKELMMLIEKEEELFSQSKDLTPEDQKKKEELMSQGFSNWSKKDFHGFIRAIEKFGRTNISKIANYLSKSEEDVQKYSNIFWERINELEDHQKILAQIARGEEKFKKREKVKRILEIVLKRNLELKYVPNTKSRFIPPEIDRKIIEIYNENFDNPDYVEIIKRKLFHDKKSRFDFFVKTATSFDLSKRINTLIVNLLKYEWNYFYEANDE
ncbi:putative global transcription activator SNF2L1 [Dictyocoela muelleri]|nr:putative global transcription activator SNF2L1 [Dictyocoela muelleri]